MTAIPDTTDPLRAFLDALPPHARHHVNRTARLTALVHAAVRDHGWTPQQLAQLCSHDLGSNPGGVITFRLERDAVRPPAAPAGPRRLPFCSPECKDNAGWILDGNGRPINRCPCRTAPQEITT